MPGAVVFRNTDTVLLLWLAKTRSGLPSPLRSPTATMAASLVTMSLWGERDGRTHDVDDPRQLYREGQTGVFVDAVAKDRDRDDSGRRPGGKRGCASFGGEVAAGLGRPGDGCVANRHLGGQVAAACNREVKVDRAGGGRLNDAVAGYRKGGRRGQSRFQLLETRHDAQTFRVRQPGRSDG